MNQRVKYMNEWFKYLTQQENTQEYQTFFLLLEKMKYDSNLLEYYGEEFVEHIMGLLFQTQDPSNKALLIETIIECLDFYKLSDSYLKTIFEIYISCIAEKEVGLKDLSICIVGFLQAGFSLKEVINKLGIILDKESLMRIYSKLYVNYLSDMENKPSLIKEVEKNHYLSQRSGIIAQFLLLVHPLVREHAGISQITFLYESYQGVYEDCWPRGLLPNKKDFLIEMNILTAKELSVLEELDRLINTQEKRLDSIEVQGLYNDFFQGRDFIETIFTLPV